MERIEVQNFPQYKPIYFRLLVRIQQKLIFTEFFNVIPAKKKSSTLFSELQREKVEQRQNTA